MWYGAGVNGTRCCVDGAGKKAHRREAVGRQNRGERPGRSRRGPLWKEQILINHQRA